MRCCGRQCRGHGHVLVKLVRHTAHKLRELGEPITALGQRAQHPLAQATTLSDAPRKRVTEAFTGALSHHAHIRKPSHRLTPGQPRRPGKLVKADELTIAPILTGKRNGPGQFGRKPGSASDPAPGCIFANRGPAGNPSAPSDVFPLRAKVQSAIARVTTPQRLRVQSVAGDRGLHDEALRQALHAQGILTVGIPQTIEPIKAHPSPAEVLDLRNAAGLNRLRTPPQVHLAGATGYSRPVVESPMASLLARGAGQVHDKGLEGAVLQQGMPVLAQNGAVVVRIRRPQWSKRAHKFRRLLGLKLPKINEINYPKN